METTSSVRQHSPQDCHTTCLRKECANGCVYQKIELKPSELIKELGKAVIEEPVIKKLKVGDIIFLKKIERRRGDKESIRSTKISKVGKKWFYVTEDYLGRYNIETMMQDGGQYSPHYKAYRRLQEISDEIELDRLSTLVKERLTYYSTYKMSLSQARQIAKILNIENATETGNETQGGSSPG